MGAQSDRKALPVDVMTFNTAGDGCKHTPEAQIPLSAPFQKVVQGAADAPIIAMQEATRPLEMKLTQLSRNGNFQVVSQGPAWLPSFLRESVVMPDNLLVVPKRYQIRSVHWVNFGGRLGLVFDAIKGFLFGHQPATAINDAMLRWGYCDLQLQDKETGKRFTVLATHLCGRDSVRKVLEPQLVSAIRKAESHGPVVVMGDLNTPSEATNFDKSPDVTRFWSEMSPAHLVDQHPTDATSGHKDIDHILTSGFTSVGDVVYDGGKLTIPGRPDASQVSDHFAHGESLDFATVG